MLTHDDDPSGGRFFADRPRHIQSAQARHADIEENKIGKKFENALDRLGSIYGFAADFAISRRGENGLNAAPDVFVVVRDENSHRSVRSPHAYLERVSPNGLSWLGNVFRLSNVVWFCRSVVGARKLE
jgi:hypothetical protein